MESFFNAMRQDGIKYPSVAMGKRVLDVFTGDEARAAAHDYKPAKSNDLSKIIIVDEVC